MNGAHRSASSRMIFRLIHLSRTRPHNVAPQATCRFHPEHHATTPARRHRRTIWSVVASRFVVWQELYHGNLWNDGSESAYRQVSDSKYCEEPWGRSSRSQASAVLVVSFNILHGRPRVESRTLRCNRLSSTCILLWLGGLDNDIVYSATKSWLKSVNDIVHQSSTPVFLYTQPSAQFNLNQSFSSRQCSNALAKSPVSLL